MSSPDPQSRVYNNIFTAFFEEKFFPDLKAVLLWLIVSIIFIYVPVLNNSPLRVFFALPIVLFIPGYALIAALFAGKEEIDIIERVALSFGLSIAVVPLIGLGLNYTPFGIRLDPIVTSLVLFTGAMVMIAQYRRALLPVDQRFILPFRACADGMREEFFNPEGSRTDRILSIILLIAICAAVLTTMYVIVVPKEGEKFTEFYILGEKKMAADYPERLMVNEDYPMYIGIGNHEYRNVTYTVETHLLNMTFDEETNTSAIDRTFLMNVTTISLPHNETMVLPFNLSTPSTGFNRVEFLLFNESVPEDSVSEFDRINASYRDLHLWVKTNAG